MRGAESTPFLVKEVQTGGGLPNGLVQVRAVPTSIRCPDPDFFRRIRTAAPHDRFVYFSLRSRAALFQKMSSTWVSLRRSDQQAHFSDRKCSRPVKTGLSA